MVLEDRWPETATIIKNSAPHFSPVNWVMLHSLTDPFARAIYMCVVGVLLTRIRESLVDNSTHFQAARARNVQSRTLLNIWGML
jgi:hypothetical protein